MAAQAEPVVSAFEADHVDPRGVWINGVTRGAAQVGRGWSVVATRAVLYLPVQLVHER